MCARAGGASPDASWFSCVAADKTVRAPGLAAMTERGFQPAATPEDARAGANGQGARARVLGRPSAASWFSCVAADKTVRAPGLAAMTERGFQPAATPEGARAVRKAKRACARAGGLSAASWFSCVAADKTVRAPGMAGLCSVGARHSPLATCQSAGDNYKSVTSHGVRYGSLAAKFDFD